MKFQPTGNASIDKILSAIEHAARENKNSDHWADHDVGEVSDLEMIQEAACEARGEVERLRGVARSVVANSRFSTERTDPDLAYKSVPVRDLDALRRQGG